MLFNFFSDLLWTGSLTSLGDNHGSDELETAVESSLAVFSILLDDPASNQFSDKFPPIAERFKAILQPENWELGYPLL